MAVTLAQELSSCHSSNRNTCMELINLHIFRQITSHTKQLLNCFPVAQMKEGSPQLEIIMHTSSLKVKPLPTCLLINHHFLLVYLISN